MAYWQYSQSRRLPPTQAARLLDVREPACLECLDRLHRLAVRQQFDPWRWIVIGWRCQRCNAVYLEDF